MTKREKIEVRNAVVLSHDKALDALRVLKAKTRKGSDLDKLRTLEGVVTTLNLIRIVL